MQIVANIQCQKSNMDETTGSPLARYESLEQHYTGHTATIVNPRTLYENYSFFP